ncbi:MAG: type I restriction-modification system subunit M [Myxococcales bacterium]|nr:type I restriction-modification system subunit M [Myxococcales bacterium]
MPRPSKRAVLDALNKATLIDLARRHGIAIASSQAKSKIVTALVSLKPGDFRRLLERLRRDDLRAICRAHDLPDSARTKDELIVRLIGEQPDYLSLVPSDTGATIEESGTRYQVTPKPPPPRPGERGQLVGSGALTELPTNPSGTISERRTTLEFESQLWRAADKLRSNMDAAEYKHVVLGLLFLKYISDAFADHREQLLRTRDKQRQADDPSRFRGAGVFWAPLAARWKTIADAAAASDPALGQTIDAAMAALEVENPELRGVLPRRYSDPARPSIDPRKLAELVELVGTINLHERRHRARDVLGRVYEYFLTKFAAAEGRNGGQFYTPRSVVALLVEMMAPERGSVYDPACGSGGMFVQSERFVAERGGESSDIALYGQESNPTTWRLAKMNLAIRQLAADLGPRHADSFHEDHHPDLRADYVLANPPFNAKDWGAAKLEQDPRWRYGVPPNSNANFAWVQHFIHHLAPLGLAGFVLANGAMSTTSGGEGDIRKAIVLDDLVDCMVALPAQLFYSTQIPVSLWILARSKQDPRFRDRRGQTLFIDARDLGVMVDRTHRELPLDDISRVAATYHAFRGGDLHRAYEDQPGFCRVATIHEIARNDYVLSPGRYVTPAEEPRTDGPAYDERVGELARELEAQFEEATRLEQRIKYLLGKVWSPT